MTISAIIPSFYQKDKDYLELCVESLRDSGFEGEIIVVTNGHVENPDLAYIKGVSKHLHTRDQGQCGAVNIGAQMAMGDYLFIINSDMYFAPGWDKNLRFDHQVFSPNLIEPSDNPGSATPFRKLPAGYTLEEFSRSMVDDSVGLWTAKPDRPLEEPGFNLPFFIKRDFWNFLGGYDRNYDPWGSNSDTDLQTRINLAGVTPMRLRDVLVYHFSNKSGTFDGTHQEEYQHNLKYFHEKFGFDRDELGSDVWYNQDMIPKDKERIIYGQPRFPQS